MLFNIMKFLLTKHFNTHKKQSFADMVSNSVFFETNATEISFGTTDKKRQLGLSCNHPIFQ